MEPTLKPTASRPVMDIQPQRRPAPAPVVAPRPVAPVAPAPPEPAQPPVAPQPPIDQPLEVYDDHPGLQPTPEHYPADLPKVKTPKLAILLAVLVSGGLIGLTVFGYYKTQDKEEVATPETTTQPITTEDVETSVTATDEALEALDDTADFNTTDLADDSLGL